MTKTNQDGIASVARLEEVVGSRPLGALLKSIDALDPHCERLLGLSPFAVVGLADASGSARAAVLGGPSGFARVASRSRVLLPRPENVTPVPGSPASLLFFIPGLGETLRVNGRVGAADDGLVIEVDEAFAHCAKALIRSALWHGGAPPEQPFTPVTSAAGPLADPEIRDFLARAPFAVLASRDAAGAADASPKGDPAGFLAIVGEATVAVPDRPGNRRTDTFHNVLDDPATAIVVLVPGDPRVLELSGQARLSDDATLLASMAVRGKVPKVALLLDVARAVLAPSAALAAADLWNPAILLDAARLPRMSQVFIDHVKLNKQRGVAAAAMRTLASERMLGAALESDYKNNLY
jgi:uncharacterized protein